MNPEIAAVMALGTTLVGIGGYLLRGQVRGTQADKLWDVAEGMRKEQAARLDRMEKRVEELEKANAVKEAVIEQQRRQIEKLEAENLKLAQDAAADKARAESEISYLSRRVQELEAKTA
jgi:predicted RNase H-like nuclease (RuvC/YqgF family)